MRTRGGGSARATRSMPTWRRAALAGEASAIPKQTDGIVESLRQLRVARQGAIKARTAAMAQLEDLIITAPEPLRERLCEPRTIRGKAIRCRRQRPTAGELAHPAQAARFALRSLARRIESLDDESHLVSGSTVNRLPHDTVRAPPSPEFPAGDRLLDRVL